MNILVVDDNRSIRMVIEQLVEKINPSITVASCANKEDAQEMINRHTFDGAILDLVLENGTGVEIAKFCEEKNIPVVFCTSTSDDHNTKMMYRYGWIIPKPIMVESISRCIEYFKTFKR